VLKKLIGNSPLTLTAALDALRKCQPSASLSTPQTPHEWRGVIWKTPQVIRKLPKPLRTEEMYLLLLAADCPLPKLAVHEMVAEIPSGSLSERVRMAAFLLSPKSLLRLPAAFDLHQEYARCLNALADPAPYIKEVPAQFLPLGLS
jgi:hypothetical protein